MLKIEPLYYAKAFVLSINKLTTDKRNTLLS